MSCFVHAEHIPDRGPIYVLENGELYKVNQTLRRIDNRAAKSRPSRLLSKEFSIQLCRSRENDNGRRDHFIFTYTKEGNLRYSAKCLFSLVLSYVADNINYVDSLIGFPEQIAEKLFYAADARQKFTEPKTGLGALQKFTEVYGSSVLQKLCLKNGFLVISEKLEEIKTFQGLTCLDLSFCKLGDEHELLEHITSRRLSSLTQLFLKDNCLSDGGLRKMTAPVRVMKRGLENLLVLDLSCNPGITKAGLRYLFSFKKLKSLDLSGTGLKDTKEAVHHIQTQMGLTHSEMPLEEFCHRNCKTEGWAEQTILQWEHATVEAVKPTENLKSRTAAQQFYGKRARTEEPLDSSLEEREREMSANLQFYKQRVEMLPFPLQNGNTEMNKGLQIKKRAALEDSEHNFKSKQLSFSMADWDLLHSY